MRELFYSYDVKYGIASAFFATVGGYISCLLGGFDIPVRCLLLFMTMDFLTGWLAALKKGELSSNRMFWGGINKILVLAFVAFGVVLDMLALTTEPYFRMAILWFYIAREGLSIVENYGKLGLPLPDVVKKALEQLSNANVTEQSK